MVDFKLYFMWTRVFKQRLIWTIVGSVIVIVLLLCWLSPFIDQGVSNVWEQLSAEMEPQLKE